LLELDKVDEAIKHLQTAFELGKKDPSSYYDDTIPSKLRYGTGTFHLPSRLSNNYFIFMICCQRHFAGSQNFSYTPLIRVSDLNPHLTACMGSLALDPHFLESLDMAPDLHFDPDPKFFLLFHMKTLNFSGKNHALDRDLQIFQALDPDPQKFQALDLDSHEMDVDPEPCF